MHFGTRQYLKNAPGVHGVIFPKLQPLISHGEPTCYDFFVFLHILSYVDWGPI